MRPGTSEDLDAAVEVIGAAPALALACHLGPDGDALGSMLALHHLARAQGVASVASWSEPFVVAPHYRFLPGLDLASPPAQFPEAPEVMVTFDCGSVQRLGDLAWPAKAARTLVVLDHHASNDRFGSINVVDVDAAATAVVVRGAGPPPRLAPHLATPPSASTPVSSPTPGGSSTTTPRPRCSSWPASWPPSTCPIAVITRQLFEEHRSAT